jgi:Beta-galactosidase
MHYYGVAYYPELRTSEQIESDLTLLAEAGMNLIRVGEFAWCELEPAEGIYRFEWLESVVERASSKGIWTVLCTPTAAPPAWLTEQIPDMGYVDSQGRQRPFGSRRHYCYNHPRYRELSSRIAEKLAARFRDHPRVIGYQIDNEMAQEGTGRCRCNLCKRQFHAWLERKYGSIEQLNARWGTVFWGQRYDSFEQINLPVATMEANSIPPIPAFFDNPSLRLDFERFCSQSQIEYMQIQAEALRTFGGPHQTVTTNGTGTGTNSINYFEAFAPMDRYGVDAYPDLRGEDLYAASFEWSLARNVVVSTDNHRFWVLELACGGGHGLWGFEGRLQPYPGAIKQLALHAFSSGAELVTHFQYLQFPYGAEQLNYSILDADGIPRRRYEEVRAAASDLREMADMLERTEIRCDTALLFDYDSLWSLGIKPVHREFTYVAHAREWYSRLLESGIGADVISAEADFDRYAMLIVPSLFVTDCKLQAKLKAYVANGGTLIATFLTSVKNKDNVAHQQSLPAGLTDLFGIHVTEWEPVFERSMATVGIEVKGERRSGPNRYWTESLEQHGAVLTAEYRNTFRQGQGVISSYKYGSGTAHYVGTTIAREAGKEWLVALAEQAGVSIAPFQLPSGVEVIRREGEGETVWVLFNANTCEKEIAIDGMFVRLSDRLPVPNNLRLPAKGYIALVSS